jgi:hypothetical protein
MEDLYLIGGGGVKMNAAHDITDFRWGKARVSWGSRGTAEWGQRATAERVSRRLAAELELPHGVARAARRAA